MNYCSQTPCFSRENIARKDLFLGWVVAQHIFGLIWSQVRLWGPFCYFGNKNKSRNALELDNVTTVTLTSEVWRVQGVKNLFWPFCLPNNWSGQNVNPVYSEAFFWFYVMNFFTVTHQSPLFCIEQIAVLFPVPAQARTPRTAGALLRVSRRNYPSQKAVKFSSGLVTGDTMVDLRSLYSKVFCPWLLVSRESQHFQVKLLQITAVVFSPFPAQVFHCF